MTKPSNMNRCGVCTLPMADACQKAEYVKPTRGVCLCLLFKFQLQDPYRGQSLRRSVAQSDKGKGKGQGKIQIIDDKDGLQQRWASESAYVASCERGMGINDIIAEARAHGRLVISPHIINANVQDAKGKDADKGNNKGQDKDKGKDEQIECDGGANDNAMPEKDDDDLDEIMGEMDQKSTSEIMGKSDDTSEKGSDWRGYMDEERNRIGGGHWHGAALHGIMRGSHGHQRHHRSRGGRGVHSDPCSTPVGGIEPEAQSVVFEELSQEIARSSREGTEERKRRPKTKRPADRSSENVDQAERQAERSSENVDQTDGQAERSGQGQGQGQG